MGRIFATVGLPGSGKSHAVKIDREKSSLSMLKTISIEGDSLRVMFGGGKYWFDDYFEPYLYSSIIAMIQKLLPLFDIVYLDEALMTNTADNRRFLIHQFPGTQITFHWTQADVKTCMERRYEDPKGLDPKVWEEVINHHNEVLEPLGNDKDVKSSFVTYEFETTDKGVSL